MRQQTVSYSSAEIIWYFNNKWHRDEDLPAVYYFSDGKLTIIDYYQHGELHHTTGPAIIYYKYKYKEYFYQGKQYANLEQMQMLEACR